MSMAQSHSEKEDHRFWRKMQTNFRYLQPPKSNCTNKIVFPILELFLFSWVEHEHYWRWVMKDSLVPMYGCAWRTMRSSLHMHMGYYGCFVHMFYAWFSGFEWITWNFSMYDNEEDILNMHEYVLKFVY